MSELRQFTGQLRMAEERDPLAYGVELWLVNDADNRNRERFTNLAAHVQSFHGAPILVAYTQGGAQVGDGHNFDWQYDPKEGEEFPSFTGADAERIVGILGEEDDDFRLVEEPGRTWVVGRGKLWAWYAKELVDKIREYAEQGRSLPVSIEALVYESHMEGDIEVEDQYEILGVTILGEHVTPAVAGARVVKLQAVREQMGALKLRAAAVYEEAKVVREEKKEEKRMGYSEEQLLALGEKFPGYRVLAAESVEGAVHVCLSCGNGAFARYIMESEDAEVDLGAVETVNPAVVFRFEEQEVAVECSNAVAELTTLSAAYATLSTEAEELRGSVAQLSEDLRVARESADAFREQERRRRAEAAKAKVLSVLEAFNEGRECPVEEECVQETVTAADNGEYNECEDDNGEWCGEAAVERDVLAICAKADMAQRKTKTEAHQWGGPVHKPAAGGVEGLLQRKGIL